jgi:hypothetical protein
MADERSVQAHYRAVGLLDRIVAGLREAGKDPDAPSVDDLAPAHDSSPRRTGVTSPVLTLCLSFAPWPTSCPA